jgi:signal transduction histidine kinase
VEILTWQNETPPGLNDDKRILLTEAATRGHLAAGMSLRESATAALRRQAVALVVHRRIGLTHWVALLSGRSSLREIKAREIDFVATSLEMVAAGYQRIQAWQAAQSRDRLATAGHYGNLIRHEARNQLAAIRAVLEMLAEWREKEIDEEQRKLVLASCEGLIRDFNLTLEMSRREIGPTGVVWIQSVMDSACAVFKGLARNRHVALELIVSNEPMLVQADRQLLQQVMVNLLQNAFEALDESEQPKITLRSWHEDGMAKIEIGDNGPGVPERIHDLLFAEHGTTKTAGTGLGLVICRNTVLMMNGMIEYMNRKGEPHARFQISFPLDVAGGKADVALIPSGTPTMASPAGGLGRIDRP